MDIDCDYSEGKYRLWRRGEVMAIINDQESFDLIVEAFRAMGNVTLWNTNEAKYIIE